jgi:ATP-dependent DNA helicase RecG
MYPESACREAVVNAIAHRDYADEGAGVEVYVFDDRMEIKSPGGLLSTISVDDLKMMKGSHQSRNSNVARTLRELGYMRELGEGMRRIFELMKSNELAPPDILDRGSSFSLTLHHKAMYSRVEELWLEQFGLFGLNAEHKAIILLGRKGELISPQNIIDRVGIVDTEHYRQLIDFLLRAGLIKSELTNAQALKISRNKKVGKRDIPRFRVSAPTHTTAIEPQKKAAETSISIQLYDVFVGNIPVECTEEQLFDAFKKFGSIEKVSYPGIARHRKGYAFVSFDNDKSAQAAISAASIELLGRRLAVSPSRAAVKAQRHVSHRDSA